MQPTDPDDDWRAGLRPYQVKAVHATVTQLPHTRRGTLVMACGTGKTVVSLRTAEQLAATNDDTVLVLAPSLPLLDQLYRQWSDQARIDYLSLAVCSDDDLGSDDDADTRMEDTPVRVTTDPDTIASFLTGHPSQRKVIFATYHSTPVLADATRQAGHEWTLAICDEAHRTAGRAGAVFTTILSNAKIPCRMRLFVTASPRVHSATVSPDGRALLSMDDETIYGPRLYTYTFGEGIAQRWLTDYRILVLAVDSTDVYRSIHQGDGLSIAGRGVNSARAASILGLLQAAAQHSLARIITFHNTISASRHFATDLAYLSAQMADPARRVESYHLDGLASPAARKAALDALGTPANRDLVVVNNVRVLSEGVDIPRLDGVMFAEPRTSQVDVIQAVGRAIRRSPDKDSPSLIIIPVYLAPGENPAAVLEGSNFRHVWQVLNALRDHDAALDAHLARIRRNDYDHQHSTYQPGVLPDKITITGASPTAEEFTDAITTLILDHTTTTWAYGLDRFNEYRHRHGSSSVPARHVDEATQFPLGQWVQSQRQAYRWRRLTDQQVIDLENAGFEWGRRSAQWRKNIGLVKTLTASLGERASALDLCLLAPTLAPWFRSLNERNRQGRLTSAETAELNDLARWRDHDPLHQLFNSESDVNRLLRSISKRRRLPTKTLPISIPGIHTPQYLTALIDIAAQHQLFTDEHRQSLISSGVSIPDSQPDIDLTSPTWEVDAQRYIAQVHQRIYPPRATSGPRQSTQSRPPHVDPAEVTLDSLVAGPSDTVWRQMRILDHPRPERGFDNVLPQATELVATANALAGSPDEFVVLSDRAVMIRREGHDDWARGGSFQHHVELIVGTVGPIDRPDLPHPRVLVEERASQLPHELIIEVGQAILRSLLPPDDQLIGHIVKRSYGVKQAKFFTSSADTEAAFRRAQRQRHKVTLLADLTSDRVNQAMREMKDQILRQALVLTIPKVVDAYESGTLSRGGEP